MAPVGAARPRRPLAPLCFVPQSYTTCALGIQFVGYVMICFSAINSLCSVLYGRISQYTGRAALYALGRWTRLPDAGGGTGACWLSKVRAPQGSFLKEATCPAVGNDASASVSLGKGRERKQR